MGGALEVRVLGPVDAVGPAGPIPVGGRQNRAVLAALAIGAGRAVSIDHLGEVLWPNQPPDGAENTLQSHISQLRHLMGADTIVSVDHSYSLRLEADAIDAVRFERLVADAAQLRDEPPSCQDVCRQALGLWRGRPFGDLADDESFRLEAYRLDQLRLLAMELTLEADLALGRDELVVGELEVAVAEHPYRERLWFLLIGALARSGRRVEAMRTCSRLRTALAEAGLEPSDRLSAMEQDILAGHVPSIAP